MTNPFADLIPEANRSTEGLATTFGYNDPEDGGEGAWGADTNNTEIMGASLPRQLIRDHFGDEDKANGAFVEVVNPSNGKRIVVPLVDKGPAKRVIDRQGPTIDLTYAANQAVGGTGKTPVSYRILGSNPFADLIPGGSSPEPSEPSGGSEAEDPFAALIPKAPAGPPALTPRMADTLGANRWSDPFDGTEVRRGIPVRLPSVKTVENETTFPLAIGPKRNDWQDAGNSFMSGVADGTVAMGQGIYSQADALTGPSAKYLDGEKEELEILRARKARLGGEQRLNTEGGHSDPELDQELTTAGNRIFSLDYQAKQRGEKEYQGSTLQFINEGYRKISDNLGKQRDQNKEFWGVDKDFQESFTGQLIGAAGGMVPQVLASALPGLGVAAMQSQAFQFSMDDARETAKRTGQPFDPDKAFAYAMTNSFQQALLEKVGLNTVLGTGIKKAGKVTFTTLRNRVVKSILAEGGTESWQGANQDKLASVLGIEKRNPFDLRKRGTEFAIGSVLGAGLTTVTTVSQKLEQNAAEAQQKLADAVKAAAAAKAAADQAAARAAAAQTTTPPAAASAPQATTPPAQKYNPEKAGTFRDFSQIPAATAPAEGAPITQPTSDEELDAKIAEYQREEGDETAAAPASKIEADLREGDDRFAPNREGGFVDTSILNEVIDYGRSIYRKGMDFLDWSMQMVKQFGETVAPYLRKAWNAIDGGQLLSSARNRGSTLVPSPKGKDVYARSLEDIKKSIPANERWIGTKLPGEPVRAPDGRRFLEHDLSVKTGPMNLTQDRIDKAWAEAIDETGPAASRAIAELSAKGFTMKPPGASHWKAAENLPAENRLWYEISAETFTTSFPNFNREKVGVAMDVVAATSPLADPKYNARLAISIMAEDYQNVPSVTPAVVQKGVKDALMGEFGRAEQRKIGSFGSTFRFLEGMSEDPPLTTNDRQVAASMGIPDHAFGSYPVLYELMSRFNNNQRDVINENGGMNSQFGPFQSHQLQALSWVQTRAEQRLNRRTNISEEQAFEGDAYASAFKLAADLLRQGGVPVPSDPATGLPLFTSEVLSNPRVQQILSPLGTTFLSSSIQTMEMNTKLREDGRKFSATLEESKRLGINKNLELAEKVLARAAKALTLRSTDSAGDKASAVTRLARVFGLPTADISRVEFGRGTFRGDVSPNVRIPLDSVPEKYRPTFLAVLGKCFYQAAQGASRFESVAPPAAQTHSVWMQGKGDMNGLEDFAQALTNKGHEANISQRPNGVLIDVHPKFTDQGPVPISPVILETLAEDVLGKGNSSVIPRNYDSIYLERQEYDSTILKATKELLNEHAEQISQAASISLRDGKNYLRGDANRHVEAGALPLNRRAEKIRDSYRQRLDQLQSSQKELRSISRVFEKDTRSATEAMQKRIDASIKKSTLRAKLKSNGGFINTEILGEVVDYGKTIFRKGMDYLDWSVQMVRDLGDGVRSVLRKVWDTINGGQLLPSARQTGAARVPNSVKPLYNSPVTTSQNLSGKRTWDFANPIGNLSRLYKGTADIFNETPGLEFLGRAILQHVDTARRYYGQMTTPFRKWSQRHTAGNRKAALVAFEGYFRENERNKPLANSIYAAANPAGRELIDLWKDAANETGAINQRNNLMVWDGNLQTFRPIGKVGPEYFPRMVKPEVLATLRNPTRNPKGWDALVNEMLAEGIIAKPEDAAAYASTVAESYRSNDHFGAIERARSLPLPSKAYDYSFETARRYLASWSERMAQVEAYGQKVGTEGKDLFDKAQAIAADQPTKDYIKRVQDRAYNVSLDSGIARFAASASTLSTGLQLGNPATTLKNLISGMAFTGQAYGVRRTLGTLLNLKKTFDGINDAYEKGILIDDLMNIMADGEKAVAARPLQTFARVALNVSGFAASEVWVRGVNMVAARAMLRDALKANQKDPLSRRSLQYRGFFARLGLRSPQALLDENGTGPETDKYLRAAVNEVQGGYRFDQVPQFMDTPAGRFLFKYQKWGSQQLRHFARNVANPFVQAVSLGKLGNSEYIRVRDPKTGNVVTRRVPGAVMPMARYLLLLAAAGAATEELLKMLFGIPEKEASWGEVLATLDKDTAAGVGMIATKIWGYHLLVGSMGQLGNYLQMGRDVVARSRFKNPLDPPSVAPLKGVSDLMLDWWEQGTITPDNLDQFSRTQLSMYRVGKQAAARVNDVFGGEFRGLQMETRRQDLQWLNGVSRRYNSQLGVQKNRTQFGRIGKSPQSPFRNGLKQDLLLGDTSGARKRLNVWLGAMPAERRKMELTSLMASVRASQPVKAGYGSEAMRINFLSWSRENLSAADVQRVKAIDSTYRNTARAVGLMKDQTDISESDLDEAMQKIRLKSGQ